MYEEIIAVGPRIVGMKQAIGHTSKECTMSNGARKTPKPGEIDQPAGAKGSGIAAGAMAAGTTHPNQ